MFLALFLSAISVRNLRWKYKQSLRLVFLDGTAHTPVTLLAVEGTVLRAPAKVRLAVRRERQGIDHRPALRRGRRAGGVVCSKTPEMYKTPQTSHTFLCQRGIDFLHGDPLTVSSKDAQVLKAVKVM